MAQRVIDIGVRFGCWIMWCFSVVDVVPLPSCPVTKNEHQTTHLWLPYSKRANVNDDHHVKCLCVWYTIYASNWVGLFGPCSENAPRRSDKYGAEVTQPGARWTLITLAVWHRCRIVWMCVYVCVCYPPEADRHRYKLMLQLNTLINFGQPSCV